MKLFESFFSQVQQRALFYEQIFHLPYFQVHYAFYASDGASPLL